MTQIMKIAKVFEVATNKPIDWVTLNIVNSMLKDAGINAKFITSQQNIYFDHEDGEIIKLEVREVN